MIPVSAVIIPDKLFPILKVLLWVQFVLDMQFVIQVAINGRFSSRHMRQVVNDVTARAVTAFTATGGDPHRSVSIVIFSNVLFNSLIFFASWVILYVHKKFLAAG